jgi:hypothetical protein
MLIEVIVGKCNKDNRDLITILKEDYQGKSLAAVLRDIYDKIDEHNLEYLWKILFSKQ